MVPSWHTESKGEPSCRRARFFELLYDRDAVNIARGHEIAVALLMTEGSLPKLASRYANAGIYVLLLRLHPRKLIAWAEDAWASCRKSGDRQAEGAHLGNLGLAYSGLGETRKAIEHYERALA